MAVKRWIPLRVLTFNTHVGLAVTAGALNWLLKQIAFPHLVFLQEVKPRAVKRLGRIYPTRNWGHVKRGTQYTVYKKSRFTLLWVDNEVITFGEKHRRDRLVLGLYDKRANRLVVACNAHTAPMGKGLVGANARQRRIHMEQTQAYADRMAQVPEGAVAIAGGDWNEDLDLEYTDLKWHRRSALGRLGRAGMVPVYKLLNGWVRFDDIFLRPERYIRPKKRRVVHVPFKVVDHKAIFVAMKVRRLRKKNS